MNIERCLCGSWDCASCGRAMGYIADEVEDADERYERVMQDELDSE